MESRVFVKSGRNKGKYGIILMEKDLSYYVDFGCSMIVNEGFGSYREYRDAYWILKTMCEIV